MLTIYLAAGWQGLCFLHYLCQIHEIKACVKFLPAIRGPARPHFAISQRAKFALAKTEALPKRSTYLDLIRTLLLQFFFFFLGVLENVVS